jgi:hypothetical protein
MLKKLLTEPISYCSVTGCKENNMKVIYAPDNHNFVLYPEAPTVFLGGSIEMGKAKDWQTDIEETLKPHDGTLLNPRRKDWDSSWTQTIENDQFREQVEWELDGMDGSSIVFLNFEPDTKSPITLLELGLRARYHTRTLVCCPEKFWRKGNVDVVCKKYDVMLTDDYEKAKIMLEAMILMWKPSSLASIAGFLPGGVS